MHKLNTNKVMNNSQRFTLANVISKRIYDDKKGWIDFEINLTDEHKAAFVDLFGKRCHEKTKRRLQSFINYPSGAENHGIYERVVFNHYGQPCHYVAGQSYPDELRIVRNLICNR
jgi:hypothetical protein